MLVRILLPILVTDCHCHNSGPEKMRRTNSKFLPISYDIAQLVNYYKHILVSITKSWKFISTLSPQTNDYHEILDIFFYRCEQPFQLFQTSVNIPTSWTT